MYKAELIEKKPVSKNIFNFLYKRPSDFNYLAGQYISLLVGKSEKRSYSLSSSPFDKNIISSIVDISPGGIGTTYLNKIKIGKSISFEGPYGHMVLPPNYQKQSKINFVCTGTGICPFISIIKDLNQKGYKGEINLLYSEKFKNDFSNLADLKISNLYLSLTREKAKSIAFGRVTEHLYKLPKDKALFFLCGNTRMLTEVIKILKNEGLTQKNLVYESFYY